MKTAIFSLFALLLNINVCSQINDYIYLKGHIDKHPITIILNLSKEYDTEETKFHGYYFYDSKQIPIELYETYPEDSYNFALSTFMFDEEEQEIFLGKFENSVFKGKWKKNKHTLPFELKVPEKNNFVEMVKLENLRIVPIITSENDDKVEGHFEFKFIVPKNPELQKELLSKVYEDFTDFNSYTNKKLDQMANSYKEEITTFYKEYGEIRPTFSYQYDQFISPYLDTNELLIMRYSNYEYTGGAHGLSLQVFYNYDKINKKWLKIEDVLNITKENEINKILDKTLRKKYKLGPNDSYENAEEIVFLSDEIKLSHNFTLSKEGITFHYDLYEMTPYAYGYFNLFVPYEDLKPYLNKNFKL